MPKAVRFKQLGGPEVIEVEQVQLREPGPGEVHMRVQAVGLNRAESMYYHGQYFETPELPSGIGYEAVGEVTAVGEGVAADLVGRTFGTVPGYSMNRYPSLGEEAIVPASELAALPPSLSAEQGAAVWMPYGTAYGPLVHFSKLGTGDFVIITAASSSVGLAAIQIAKGEGATAIATTRTSAKKDQLLALGADHVIATQEEDLVARVKEITDGKLARVVYDPVGGSYLSTLAQATAPEGTIFLYGLLSGEPNDYPLTGFSKGVALRGSSLLQMKQGERYAEMKKYVYDRVADGRFQPKVDRVFSLDDAREAYQYLESNQQVGKIVIKTA
jgi:NADPH:quinone reductase